MNPNFIGRLKKEFKHLTVLGVAGILIVLIITACVNVSFVSGHSPPGGITPLIAAIGVIISAVALLFSAYTLYRQRYLFETTIWNTALMRLSQLYDQATQDDDLARLVQEPVDPEGKCLPYAVNLSPKQRVWLANLCMAFEQIYVATSGASEESQRAWKQFLTNKLNKPTIRNMFLRDAKESADYHKGFLEFVCGRIETVNGRSQYGGGAIKREVIDALLEAPFLTGGKALDASGLVSRPVSKEDFPFWKEMYSDSQVKRQMYSIPAESAEALIKHLQGDGKGAAFTVTLNKAPVGGFTVLKETQTIGTFGIVIHKPFRAQGLGGPIMKLLDRQAKDMGLLTLRADVYSDNVNSIRLLEKAGFRPVVWFEKNLD